MYERILEAERLLTVDLVDRAETIYREVSVQDPLNAIAVVGLARCALARGDDLAAHQRAAQALRIDPENDMARRMERRLAEILTMRGEAPERPAAAASGGRAMRPSVAETDTPVTAAPQRSLLDRLLGR